ncbi:MAG: aminopeptidase P family protein [Coprococcus sp.]|nr:aminopeptidase P family protein [Coprococcus sp.]
MAYCYRERIAKVSREMEKRGIDGFLVSPGSDMKYFIGYGYPQDDKILLLVILKDGGTFVIHNKLHDIHPQNTPVDDMFQYAYDISPFDLLLQELKRRGVSWKTAAITPNIPAFFALELKEAYPGLKMISSEELTAALRAVKDGDEMEATKEACQKADEALQICMSMGTEWVGKTERQLEARMMYEMGNLGLRNNAVSVCFGENAAIPHHHPDDTVITMGKPLLIDFGADFHFYNTDMTRMFFFGEPDEEYKRLYYMVLEAQRRGIEKAVRGSTLQELDRVVRDYLTDEGYGEAYIHRTSHGVGLDCHDYPKIPASGETVIEDGMIFSVEPGVYFPGKYGIRIEDQILMKNGKAEVLHVFPKELISFR